MKGYVVFQETISDAEAFERYKQLSPQSIAKYGGEFLVRGGPVETLEGRFARERVVVIAFPSPEAARAWYDSEEYRDAKALRLTIAEADAILVQGV